MSRQSKMRRKAAAKKLSRGEPRTPWGQPGHSPLRNFLGLRATVKAERKKANDRAEHKKKTVKIVRVRSRANDQLPLS